MSLIVKNTYNKKYQQVVKELVRLRHECGVTQRGLVAKTKEMDPKGWDTGFISRIEKPQQTLSTNEMVFYMKSIGMTEDQTIEKMVEFTRLFYRD